MKKNVKQSILKVNPYIPGKPIDDVKRELGLKSVIKLASNENPYSPSPKVLKAIAKASNEVNRYPDGGCYYLRKELSKRLKVTPEQIIFGNGSDEVICFAARAFLNKGDEVVMADPSFLMYSIYSKLEGATIKLVPLKEDFHYDIVGMKKAITKKTKIIFLGNPDNPSGKYLTQKEINYILKGLSKDILVFIDEAYFEYVTAKDYVNSLVLLKKHNNIVVTRTFSKMYGLAGLRIGYGVASVEVTDLLNRVRDPFNVNSIAQAGALACLQDGAYYQKLKKELEFQRKYLYKSFSRMGLKYQESCTNFIPINVGQDSTVVVNKLMSLGVIVRNMSAWGMVGYIRISIGSESENRRLLKALEKVL